MSFKYLDRPAKIAIFISTLNILIYTYNYFELWVEYQKYYEKPDALSYFDYALGFSTIGMSNALIIYFCFEMRIVYLKY